MQVINHTFIKLCFFRSLIFVIMSYFIPPVNYGMIEEDLYRSGQPNELNFPFLERLNLRTIIYLALEDPNPQFQSFVEEQEIQLVFLGGNTRMESRRKAWEPLSEETVLAALEIILDRSYYPIYITCHLGRDRTGRTVAYFHENTVANFLIARRRGWLSSQDSRMAPFVNF